MAYGTLQTDVINSSTGIFATNNAYLGIAKAWVYFNGVSGATINASFNVSSVTRNGTGDYTIAFTTSMPSANYCTNASMSIVGQYMPYIYSTGGGVASSPTTSSCRIAILQYNNNSASDVANICVSVFSS
jgi:hypothetical protein